MEAGERMGSFELEREVGGRGREKEMREHRGKKTGGKEAFLATDTL